MACTKLEKRSLFDPSLATKTLTTQLLPALPVARPNCASASCTFPTRLQEGSGGLARGVERSETTRATAGDGPNASTYPSRADSGEDDPTDAWQGVEDRRVTMLVPLSRHVLPVIPSNGLGELIAELVELQLRIVQLPGIEFLTVINHAARQWPPTNSTPHR